MLRGSHTVGCASALAALALASNAFGTTYQVGAGKPYANLGAVAGLLAPGDIVEVDGDQTYPGGVAFWNPGAATQKITIRGIRINGKRPVLTGGNNTIEAAANHYVFESLDLTAGVSRCFYHHAHDIVLRDSVVHDCPKQGVLGADSDSGSLLMEYTEVHHCGSGTQNHQIYMATDETTYPNSVFRMQHCYVHDAVGGNGVKTRAERNEIYYNWVEGSLYHELEMIGPDGQDPTLAREDSDVVGNVLFKRNTFSVTRCGGDGTGETNGRYRFVNNTIVVLPNASAVFRLFDGIESIQMHNNVFAVQGSGTVNLVRQVEAVWTTGAAIFAGSHNWVITGSTNIPTEWTGTITGSDPGFVDLAGSNVHLLSTSALIDQGAMTFADPPGYPFPSPLALPQWHPPSHAIEASGTAEARPSVATVDIGAYEYGTSSGGAGGSAGAGGSGGTAGTGGVGGAGGTAGTGGVGGAGGTAGTGGVGGAGGDGGSAGSAGTGVGGAAGAGGAGVGGAAGSGGAGVGGAAGSGGATAGGAGKAGAGGGIADAGPKPDAALDGSTPGDASASEPASGEDSGCGCRTAPGDSSRGVIALAIAGLAVISRRRRKVAS